MIEKTDIGDLKGIGEKTKKLFEKINVHTVGDLIRYYPHGYDVYEEAVPIWRRIRFRQLPVRSMDVYRYPEAAGCR